MTLPTLPQRVPGAAMAASMADDCDGDTTACHVCHREHPGGAGGAFCEAAGDVFAPTWPQLGDDGPPDCFECGHVPAAFRIATVQPTISGGCVGHTFNVCKRCVGPAADSLPVDVDVTITRLMPPYSMPRGLLARLLASLRGEKGKS